MRKKAAKQTTQRRTGSSPNQSGLIAKGKKPQRSATTKSTLDNRSHRTIPYRPERCGGLRGYRPGVGSGGGVPPGVAGWCGDYPFGLMNS